MKAEIPDHMVENGQIKAFTALVKVEASGALMIAVPIGDGDEPDFLMETFESAEARSFAAQLAVYKSGGGTA